MSRSQAPSTPSMPNHSESTQSEPARSMPTQTHIANLLKLFSVAFEPPTKEGAGIICSDALASDMKTTWKALELDLEDIEEFYANLQEYVGRDDQDVLHELRREFTRLFLGDKPLIANTEGLWRMKSEGRVAVLIVNSYSLEVADFMRQCGVVKAQGYNDCIDYIETECDFAAFLATNPKHLTDIGKDPLELLGIFIDEHMKLWIPGFCIDVSTISDVLYYKSLCTLMSKFMDAL